jgi:hypothetical protein
MGLRERYFGEDAGPVCWTEPQSYEQTLFVFIARGLITDVVVIIVVRVGVIDFGVVIQLLVFLFIKARGLALATEAREHSLTRVRVRVVFLISAAARADSRRAIEVVELGSVLKAGVSGTELALVLHNDPSPDIGLA